MLETAEEAYSRLGVDMVCVAISRRSDQAETIEGEVSGKTTDAQPRVRESQRTMTRMRRTCGEVTLERRGLGPLVGSPVKQRGSLDESRA